ncbi:hypothetical protein BG011_004965 [Mortierella polycephala]|uniref:Uncharacterized protein n=1 Tax=Mortierella polycephala TaxID=41804 RepID=A0A9P6U1J3_9FUNG|nr:hypothetical protein BG011_004965 [Mortierella polycephala]
MSSIGYPHTSLSVDAFFKKALDEADSSKRRRLFADARQSNLCSFQVYVFAAEAEERWGADSSRLQEMLRKGVVVFKNPAGQSAHCPKVTKCQWLSEAAGADKRGHGKTAAALRQLMENEAF